MNLVVDNPKELLNEFFALASNYKEKIAELYKAEVDMIADEIRAYRQSGITGERNLIELVKLHRATSYIRR